MTNKKNLQCTCGGHLASYFRDHAQDSMRYMCLRCDKIFQQNSDGFKEILNSEFDKKLTQELKVIMKRM